MYASRPFLHLYVPRHITFWPPDSLNEEIKAPAPDKIYKLFFKFMAAGLYFFGRDVGTLFGGKRLLALYIAGGVAGSLAHCGW